MNPNLFGDPTEQERLSRKLAFSNVTGVIFQISHSLQNIQNSARYIRALRSDISLHAGFLIYNPSTKVKINFRPWK